MALGVARGLADDDGAVAEHVVLGLGHEPLGVREQVRVGRVVPVVVRQCKVRDVAGRVARGGKLRGQRGRDLHESFLAVAAREALLEAPLAGALAVGHGSRVPHEHTARMDDEIGRDR